MAGTKFSGFTTGATTANTKIVGYDSALSTNNQYTLGQLAAGIAPSLSVDTIYSASGNILTGQNRTVTIDAGATLQVKGASLIHDFNIVGAHGTGCIGMHTNGAGNSFIDAYTLQFRGNYENHKASPFYNAIHILNTGYVGIRTNGVTNTALSVKGQGTSTNKTVIITDSGATETFSIQDDGVAKFSGQAYTLLHDIGTVATATWDIDWNNSNIQSITLNNGGAMTLNTPTNPQTGATYILKLIQGASPSTVTWTASIFKWPAATAPTLSTTAAYVDIITLIYDGTNYLGTSTLDLR